MREALVAGIVLTNPRTTILTSPTRTRPFPLEQSPVEV